MRSDHRLPIRETRFAYEVDWGAERKWPAWATALFLLVSAGAFWGAVWLAFVWRLHRG